MKVFMLVLMLLRGVLACDVTYLGGLALTLVRSTEVVDDDVGASRGEEGSVGLTQATTSTRHDDGLVVKPQLRHCDV